MNVNREADEAFMRELERTDPARYANLIRNMAHAAGAASLAQRQSERQKEHTGRPRKHRDDATKQRAYRLRVRIGRNVTKALA
jgi:hypothetical protein